MGLVPRAAGAFATACKRQVLIPYEILSAKSRVQFRSFSWCPPVMSRRPDFKRQPLAIKFHLTSLHVAFQNTENVFLIFAHIAPIWAVANFAGICNGET